MIELRDSTGVRLQLRGELDLATADLVSDRLDSLRGRGDSVVLDLDELAFIDACGIGVVLRAASEAGRDGWSFRVTRGSAPVRRLFALLDLDATLPYACGAP